MHRKNRVERGVKRELPDNSFSFLLFDILRVQFSVVLDTRTRTESADFEAGRAESLQKIVLCSVGGRRSEVCKHLEGGRSSKADIASMSRRGGLGLR